jgi:histidinol-phosphate aminotransferase
MKMNAAASTRIHGGTDALGAARFDFSTNSNACGPCPTALAAVQAADASRYPDAAYTGLRQALADFHGVSAGRVVLAASASEFIFRITAWIARQGGRSVWSSVCAYGDYAHAAQAWGLERVPSLEDAALVWACEPSSPLGQEHAAWPRALLSAGRDMRGQTVVLDCAYAPLRLSGQASLNAAQKDAVWRLFSPNKALALTGVRAAYALAPSHDAQTAVALEAMAPSWPVGAHGHAMLLAWTQPETQAWLTASLPTLAGWKAKQVHMLQALGWQCLPSDANFFCAQPPAGLDPAALLPLLRVLGIKLRDAASLGLPGHLRISAQSPEAQAALQEALVHIATETHSPETTA